MSVLYILIAFSLLVALGFLAAFLWAVRSGQYDDTHTPSMRMLFEDKLKYNDRRQSSVDGRRTNKSTEYGRRITDDRRQTS